jgi:CubicO group peptidase (beta-lactamase class C family)
MFSLVVGWTKGVSANRQFIARDTCWNLAARLAGSEFQPATMLLEFLVCHVSTRNSSVAEMRFFSALVFCFGAAVGAVAAEPTTSRLPRSTPEEQGISSTDILRFIEQAGEKLDELHSFMLVRHGHVVAEGWWKPYAAEEPHMMYSLSKSFTSTGVGLAVAEGRLSIDDPVLKFFPQEAPHDPSANLRAMRVRDLLTMSTGHHNEEIGGFPYNNADAVRTFLALPVAHKPGTHFVYNTPATFMLSAIITRLTGQSLLEYLRPRLFDPLGIKTPQWDQNAAGISIGGSGLHITTEDIAKFAQLYRQKGVWQGKRLVPSSWIEQATAKQVSNGSDPSSDWEQGYGFQFWRSQLGSYRGDGAFGQFAIVLDEYDTVIAITSGTKNMGAVMNLIWDVIVPALKNDKALSADPVAHQRLASKLSNLWLAPPGGQSESSVGKSVVGKRYRFPKNPLKIETITLMPASTPAEQTFSVQFGDQDQMVTAGFGKWIKGEMMIVDKTEPVAASGAWTADHIYTLKVVRYRTPFNTTYTLRFAGNEVLIDSEQNVGFGNTRNPQLIGRTE